MPLKLLKVHLFEYVMTLSDTLISQTLYIQIIGHLHFYYPTLFYYFIIFYNFTR